MSRKLSVVLAMVAVLASGCSRVDPKIYSRDGPVADGDTLIEATNMDAKTLNPILSEEVTGGYIDGLVFNGLLRFNENNELEPCLAEKWTISKDGKVITYYLRKGIKFHDGVEMTAEDVAFTWRVYADPTVNSPNGADYRYIQKVLVLDPYRVQVIYKKPFAPALANNFWAILPKHLLAGDNGQPRKDFNTCDFNRHPVGTGPYKFVEWKSGQQIVLEANPDYWEGKPHIHRYVLRIIPDQSSIFLGLLKGEIDSMAAWGFLSLTPEQYVHGADTPKFTDYYNKYQTDQFLYEFIGWNLGNPLFKDVQVRRALTMAIDRQAILQNVVYGLGNLTTGPFLPQSWAYNKDVKPLPFDPEGAKALLKKAGWKPGADGILHQTIKGKDTPFAFKLLTIQGDVCYDRIATIVQQQLKQVGIDCQPQIVEWVTLLGEYVNKRKYDAMVMGYVMGPEPDCYDFWHSSQMGEHQFNWVGYQNKTVDRLLVEGQETLDTSKRAEIYHRVHKIMADDIAATFLYAPYALPAVHKRFKGLLVNQNGIGWHPERWYVPRDQQKYP